MHYSGEKQCFVLACNNSKRTTAVSLSEGIGFQIWPLKKNFCKIWILVGLQDFWGNIHILECYKAMDQQAAEPVEPM